MPTPDFLGSVLPSFLTRAGFAILCGALIGIERERKGKPAGFRTNTLICFGSTLYMLISEYLISRLEIPNPDPTRIAAHVITGIGFLGAGTIIQARGTVTGLTSAATIWVVAAIGLMIGANFVGLGLLCTLLTLITLVGLEKVEPKLLGKCHFVTYDVVYQENGGRTRNELIGILADHDIDSSSMETERVDEKTSRMTLSCCDRHPSHRRFLNELWQVRDIVAINRSA